MYALLTYPSCYPSNLLLICSSHPSTNLILFPFSQLLCFQLTCSLELYLASPSFLWVVCYSSEQLKIYLFHRLRTYPVSGWGSEVVSRCDPHTDICCPHHRPGTVPLRSTGTCRRVTRCGRSNRHPSHPPRYLNITVRSLVHFEVHLVDTSSLKLLTQISNAFD